MTATVRPFSNGGEYAGWTNQHCNNCTKGVHRLSPEAWPTCELEAALLLAYGTDGHISLEIANRIGLDENENRLCSEMQPT